MDFKKLLFGFIAFAGIMWSIVLIADGSVVKIDVFDNESITENEIETYRKNVSAGEWKTHCQLGQMFLDEKHIGANYQEAFYHFFLCGKTYSWPGGGTTGGSIFHTTYKQFIPVFESDGINLALETAKDNALTHVQTSTLSEYKRNTLQQKVNRSYARAVFAQKRVSSGKAYRDLVIFHCILFLVLLLAFPPNIGRVFKRILKGH